MSFLQTRDSLFYKVSSESYWNMPVVYVRNTLVAIGHATMVAIGIASLAFPVAFIAVCLMAL